MSMTIGPAGRDAAGNVFEFGAGNVTEIPRGNSIVTYGPVLTLNPGDSFPTSGIFDIQSGTLQADNLVIIRTVTIV